MDKRAPSGIEPFFIQTAAGELRRIGEISLFLGVPARHAFLQLNLRPGEFGGRDNLRVSLPPELWRPAVVAVRDAAIAQLEAAGVDVSTVRPAREQGE